MSDPDEVCGYTTEYPDNFLHSDNICCCRDVWNDTGRCIWHADVDDKPVDELQAARLDRPERLDGAVVRGVEVRGAISFKECILEGADFSDSDLEDADLTDARLPNASLTNTSFQGADLINAALREANLENATFRDADLTYGTLQEANLIQANLSDADLTHANLPGSDLTHAYLSDADLTHANLPGSDLAHTSLSDADLNHADLSGSDLTDAYLKDADLNHADLRDTALTDATLENTDLTDTNLLFADLTDTNLALTDLTDAHLKHTDLTDADLEKASATGANFERVRLTRTDLFDADLTGAKFYAAIFDDPQLNRGTQFGDHYGDARDDADPREYDDGDVTPWDKAAWTYRHLETLAQENALPKRAREAFTERKDVRRKELRHESDLRSWDGIKAGVRWGHSMGSNLVMRYGESPWRVVGVSGVIIFVWSILYLVLGRILVPEDTSGATPIGEGLFPPVSLPTWLAEFATSLYFSVVTFTTLGYGDLQPATGISQALATVESFLGALLMALLVFVLGRRSTW